MYSTSKVAWENGSECYRYRVYESIYTPPPPLGFHAFSCLSYSGYRSIEFDGDAGDRADDVDLEWRGYEQQLVRLGKLGWSGSRQQYDNDSSIQWYDPADSGGRLAFYRSKSGR